MRPAVILILSAGLGGIIALMASDAQDISASDLRLLYDAHDWFKLRDAIAGKDVSPLFRGAAAAAFNQTSEAEEALLPLINGPTSSKDADDADDWLSYMFVRTGQYQEAAAQMDEGAPLLRMLRTLPDQTVSRSEPSSIACHLSHRRLFIPVTIQDRQTEFFVDSDANFSFMSESQATALGLSIKETAVQVHGAGGSETGFRLAVADNLAIGKVQLKNVAFMVMPDNEDVFAGLQKNEQGAIGLPVLLAFRKLRYSRGEMDIAVASTDVQGEQNLCFDGLDPVARISFEQQQLPVVLDTGAAVTEIWPPFAREFADIFHASGKTSMATENSFGGKSRVRQMLLPDLSIRVGGSDVHLRPAHVLLAQTTPNSGRYYGRLGIDVLSAVDELTIDFEALKLTLH